jgi:hypothetical protein
MADLLKDRLQRQEFCHWTTSILVGLGIPKLEGKKQGQRSY